ncbi:major allergen Pru av 1-like [Eucalyptus grandis]|uniref:major allergen Pru av 1-like n=1 Tax=Eucalyptus grandis TaxID=71139 RepID=UPI00192EC446|nr:major allergen Pru av 1-like [Eucalyptus grandis]
MARDRKLQRDEKKARMFKAAILDADNLLPKVLPQAVKSVEVLKGDGGPGTIKLMTFAEGNPYKTAKHKVEVLDKENFTYCYSIIEGEMLGTTFEKITHEVKINALPLGGSMLKCTDSYFTAEEINTWKEKVSAMYEAIEAYLLANPKGDRKRRQEEFESLCLELSMLGW